MSSTPEHLPDRHARAPKQLRADETPPRERALMVGLGLLCFGTTLCWTIFVGWFVGWLIGLW